MKWLPAFIFLIVFETAADIFAKIFERTGTFAYAIAAQLSYFIGNGFWLVALVYGIGMAKGGVLFSLTVAITAVIVGFFGGERVSHYEILGITLGIIAVGLLSASK